MIIPDYLISQIKDCKCILFLGSGASKEATDSYGKHPPIGNELSKMISQKFLGGKYDNSPLSIVSELAISESNLSEVQNFIGEIFKDFEPTKAHSIMTSIRWWGVATTNYDLLLEKAYKSNKKSCQIPIPFIENGDRVESNLKNPNALPYLKLHGCITRLSNKECPLILTPEQYIQYKKNRDRIFNHLYDWAYEFPIVFIGYSLQDPDIRATLLELSQLGEGRPRYYTVTPQFDDVQSRFWETKKITALKGTFLDFMESLDREITSPFRVIVQRTDPKSIINKHLKSSALELSDNCSQFLDTDVEYVKLAKSESILDPINFYKGYNPGWSAIEQNLDARRQIIDKILTNHFVVAESHSNSIEFILIKGYAGSGKTIILRRVAWEASREFNCFCLMLKSYANLNVAAIQELVAKSKDRIFLIIDNVADYAKQIEALSKIKACDNNHITILGAERTNEWNMKGEDANEFITANYEVHYLTENEINSLLSLLEKHNALGTLEGKHKEEKIKAFSMRAGRQLLVALHEATLGKTFEEIIEDEYNNIKPLEAQLIYLTICTLNRLNVPIRAGVLSRIHDIPFSEFASRIFKPLEKVVFNNYSNVVRDFVYKTRHPHIAEIVFERVLKKPEEKFNEYIKCLNYLNIDYEDDKKAFRKMIQARTLLEMFPTFELVNDIFQKAKKIIGDDQYLYHQMAIYEMIRPNGNLNKSSEFLKMGLEIKDDYSMKHSFAELNLRRASSSKTLIEMEGYLNEAERQSSTLIKNKPWEPHGYHTLIKSSIEKLKMYLNESEINSSIIEKVVIDTEKVLSDGLQQFPDNSFLLDADSVLASLLNDCERSMNSLTKAFESNHRNSLIAIRLARNYIKRNDFSKVEDILIKALEANNNEKKLHFLFAKYLIDTNKNNSDLILYHLKRSFTPGDNNYIAQILYGRQLFINSLYKESEEFFKKLRESRTPYDLRSKPRFSIIQTFLGEIKKIESFYCFIIRDKTRDSIYASINDTQNEIWEKLTIRSRVSFKIGFTLVGPRAFDIVIEH